MIIIILDDERKTNVFVARTLAANCISNWRTRRRQIGNDIMGSQAHYTALDIAKYIVDFCNRQDIPVSNIKLQKILYFVFGTYYAFMGQRLFDAEFAAWQHGPVVATVYDEFWMYGGSYICLLSEPEVDFYANDKSYIDRIISKYMEWDVPQLVSETHKENTAWRKAVDRVGSYELQPPIAFNDIVAEFELRRLNNELVAP